MISVVIPTLDAERTLVATLAALVPAAMDGLVREVIVVDGGSTDSTAAIADDAGAVILPSPRGRGTQLAAGAGAARGSWLLFLHADTVLGSGWAEEVHDHMQAVDSGKAPDQAAAFRFRLDDRGIAPRVVEQFVGLRSYLARLPFGDQGLLISRRLYQDAGGYLPLPIMEDVDLVRRIGRARIRMFGTRAVTSAARYRSEGYVRRIARNQACLAMYVAGVAPERIAKHYDRRGT